MKKLFFCLVFFVFPFLHTPSVDAQVVRNAKKQLVENTRVTKFGQRRRTVRRFRRRRHRRIYRRTLRNLPANVNAVRFSRQRYYPINGYYYIRQKGTYVAVAPPVGFRIARVPWTLRPVVVSNTTYHYANGLYYQKRNEEFVLAEPPIGAKVPDLPEETQTKEIDGQIYHIFDEAIYLKDDELYELLGFMQD